MEDLNNKSTNDTLTANQWNGTRSEVQNVIEDAGIVLSAGDLRQLAKAITDAVGNADNYIDTGTANVHVLGATGNNSNPTAYKDGMRVRYTASFTNELPVVTVNVNSLGPKQLYKNGVLALAYDVTAKQRLELVYNLSDDRFDLVSTGDDIRQKINGHQLDHAIYSGVSSDISNQEPDPRSVFFKPDGLTMYIAGATNNTVYQYTLGNIPWDISNFSYISKFFSFTTQDNQIRSIFFKPDGLTMYALGGQNENVYQYTLSTAWDVSTAIYASKLFDFIAQDTEGFDIHFKDDGTKMYIAGNANSNVYQYTLSTAWDVSTASYDTVTLNITPQDSELNAIVFKPDGLVLYVTGNISDNVYQYILSTAWDLSTASYDSVSFSISTNTVFPSSIFISPIGSSMFIVDSVLDRIRQYSMNFISSFP